MHPEGTNDLKMLVVEVGIDRLTQKESYRLLYCSTSRRRQNLEYPIRRLSAMTAIGERAPGCGHGKVSSALVGKASGRDLAATVSTDREAEEFR